MGNENLYELYQAYINEQNSDNCDSIVRDEKYSHFVSSITPENINHSNSSDGMTVLHLASHEGDEKTVNENLTSMYYAFRFHKLNIISKFKELGLDVDELEPSNGETYLQKCVGAGFEEEVKRALELDANINHVSYEGLSVFDYGVKLINSEIDVEIDNRQK